MHSGRDGVNGCVATKLATARAEDLEPKDAGTTTTCLFIFVFVTVCVSFLFVFMFVLICFAVCLYLSVCLCLPVGCRLCNTDFVMAGFASWLGSPGIA